MSHASDGGERARAEGGLITALLALSILEVRPARAQPAGTGFTYQGRLQELTRQPDLVPPPPRVQ